MNTFFEQKDAARMGKITVFLGLMLALFVAMLFVGQMKNLNAPGDVATAATIDVSGKGEVFAIPNVANISFTVEQRAATVGEAQATVTEKANAAIAFIKSSGVDEKDIQTTNYSANPEYTYPTCMPGAGYCVSGSGKITGYTVSETVTVKVRDTAKVGAILDGLGSKGVTGISGPNFSIDDMDAVNADARAAAIKNAEEKARVLAKQLNVRLVRIIRYSDSNGTIYPMSYSAKAMDVAVEAATPPEMAVGQNKYTSNVTITYEIR